MRLRSLTPFVLLVVGTAMPRAAVAGEEARLLRFPAISPDAIAFTYAGNIYTVPTAGGVARRVTNHDGFEMFPRFSPDGKHLAFTGQYDGNTEVYLMPAEGGTPKRLTYTSTLGRDDVSDRMGPNNIVIGWTPDGKNILFRSRMHSFNDFIGQLFTVSIDGGLAEQLPLPRGGFASYSPDGSKLAYNRVFREFRTWKRYRGGLADEVWLYDFQTRKTEPLTSDPGSDIIPMWVQDKVYFLSDRGERMRFNVWCVDPKTKEKRQLTHFTEFDCKFPSAGRDAIVFENGGYIYKLDVRSERAEKVPVQILEDGATARGGLVGVGKNVTAFGLSPDGKRAVFGARGDVFTVPATSGLTRNLTNTPGVHERNPDWSPDGKTIAYVSDASGEDEIYTIAQDGRGQPTQITSGADTYKYEIAWSPDGKKVLWSDKKLRLQFVDVESKQVTLVDQATAWEIRDFTWSPDSKWVAFARQEEESLNKVYLYSVEQKKSFEVTDGWYAASSPAFSSDGKYLFFASAREFSPIISATEWNHAYTDMQRIYFVTLAKATENPFKPKLDEVTPAAKDGERKDEGKKEEAKKDEAKKAEPKKADPKPADVKVDVDGLKDRVLTVPGPAGSYFMLKAAGGLLYYQRAVNRGVPGFYAYDVAAQKEMNLGTVGGYDVSADGKKMILSKGGNYGIVDLPRGPVEFKNLDLGGMEVRLDRQAEWAQIFRESWRQMRDFFYDPGLHGVDWPAMRAKYEVLVPHVRHRFDLTYVIGEMIAELNAGHAYVGGGEAPKPERIPTGLLGARLTRDAGSKFYKIGHILRGANWDPTLRSPLTEVGVDVQEGEYIVAVNGKTTSDVDNIYELLLNTPGRLVTLSVNKDPKPEGARAVTVTPIADESKLYYHEWVQGNIEKVSKATGGRVGYIHVPDMLTTGLNEFMKNYYPQLRRRGLIIDVRGNGGGNVSPMLIERLRREIAMVGVARNAAPTVDPSGTFVGPMVCLLNEFSASDGDLFPWRFRHHKLGPLIGKRSWGGVVGIRGSLPLLDGGFLNRPEFARIDVEGKEWIIEGHGVDPDIVQDNDPAKEFAGEDEQLNKAVEVISDKLKTQARELPKVPPFPKR
ncbi:MAG TPA: S41 family peptidase [Gemmataceae bacterium]|nr:S41 family peptidase [Gemmataceae bacterium]